GHRRAALFAAFAIFGCASDSTARAGLTNAAPVKAEGWFFASLDRSSPDGRRSRRPAMQPSKRP
ncbi:MAG: hypothetical protein ACTHL1_07310, partial [Burkholderiaceae bacterium]